MIPGDIMLILSQVTINLQWTSWFLSWCMSHLWFMKTFDQEADLRQVAVSSSETDRLLPKETMSALNYGTCYQQDFVSENYSSISSEDENICIICYDNSRNCFFVPCGHCATCCACAKRIVDDGENKSCPICRRLIHKVRRLFIP
ncbi:uncharacterized protein LOC141687281 isoform X2 [Apium graveolens]|uniref:uncharacterized protein LOC141687281 isoform X2 n=1 Tax=Apium graveolens TaxID=4045 RepID=UPI003D7A8955